MLPTDPEHSVTEEHSRLGATFEELVEGQGDDEAEERAGVVGHHAQVEPDHHRMHHNTHLHHAQHQHGVDLSLRVLVGRPVRRGRCRDLLIVAGR
eukprot:3640494-Rhodomonas_salina.3